jgi:hypothetical protein
MVYIGVLLCHKKEWTVIKGNMDRSGEHCVKWNKLGTERQMPYILSHLGKLKMMVT